MRTLVTGGSGFIGSHVVDKLVEAGHSVRVLDLKEPHRKDVEYFKGNILSGKVIKRSIKNVDFVFHFAAASNIDLVKANPVETIKFNVMGTANILDESRRNNIKRFVLASSVFVHDTRGHLYTTSKLSSEMLCTDYNKLFSLPYTILRIGTAYGPRSRNADVVSIFIQKALKGEDLVIHGDGKQKRNFIYVKDIAAACLAVVTDEAKNRVFLIAGMDTVTVEDLAHTVRNVVNPSIGICFEPDYERQDDYRGKIDNLDFSGQRIDWTPKVDLSKGIREYMKWYRKMQE